MQNIRNWIIGLASLASASVLAIILTSPALQKQAGRLYALGGLVITGLLIFALYYHNAIAFADIQTVMYVVSGSIIAVLMRLLRDVL